MTLSRSGSHPVSLVVLVALLFAAPARAGVNRWTSNGPEGGYTATAVAIDPGNPATVYVGLEDFPYGNLLFKTTNGGASGRRIGAGLPGGRIFALVIDPENPSILFGATFDGLFKSVDAGESWKSADTGIEAMARALAIDSRVPTTLYAVALDGALFKTTDGAVNWQRAVNAPTGVRAILPDPVSTSTVYAATSGGVFKSRDGGLTWSPANHGLPTVDILSLALSAHSLSTLYITTGTVEAGVGGVFRSDDGAASWKPANGGLPPQPVATLVVDPVDPLNVYAGIGGQFGGGSFRSVDGGVNWTATSYSDGVDLMAIDPTVGTTVYAATFLGGLSKTTDGGGRWAPISVGLTRTTISALAVDPSVPSTVYAGVSNGPGLLRKSLDGGTSWRASAIETIESRILCLNVDPVQSSNVYAATYRGVFKSADSGETWAPVGAGLAENAFTIAIDPRAPSTLYAGTSQGVFQSTDAGRSWRPRNAGITNSYVSAILVSPADSDTLYAGTQRLTFNGFVAGTLFKSTDRGATWSLASLGFPDVGVSALVADLKNPSTVYASTTGFGVLKTTDGGNTWRSMNAGLTNIFLSALVLDSSRPTTLYAGAYLPIFLAAESWPGTTARPPVSAPIFRTEDGGESWTLFNKGVSAEEVLALAIDPTGTSLHAGTSFSGVFDFVFATPPSRPPTHVLPPR